MRGGSGMNQTGSKKAWWTIANVLVVLYAVVPLMWIVSLSFKTPGTVKDGSFIPKEWTFENYTSKIYLFKCK